MIFKTFSSKSDVFDLNTSILPDTIPKIRNIKFSIVLKLKNTYLCSDFTAFRGKVIDRLTFFLSLGRSHFCQKRGAIWVITLFANLELVAELQASICLLANQIVYL